MNLAVSDGGGEGHRRSRDLVLAIIILGSISAVGVAAYALGYFSSPPPAGGPALMRATCSSVGNSTSGPVEHVASGGTGDHAYFLIVEADYHNSYAGMNGSAYVSTSTQWPTMYVKQGQTVSIHVINCASSEPHGFQISYYDEKSLNTVPIGQSYDVTFVASKTGDFRVFCGILCSIHPLMQNGALVVS